MPALLAKVREAAQCCAASRTQGCLMHSKPIINSRLPLYSVPSSGRFLFADSSVAASALLFRTLLGANPQQVQAIYPQPPPHSAPALNCTSEMVAMSLFKFTLDSYCLRSSGLKLSTSIFSFNICNTGDVTASMARSFWSSVAINRNQFISFCRFSIACFCMSIFCASARFKK